MSTSLFELPGQHKYRLDFVRKYKDVEVTPNIDALSRCYANYKVLGVIYPPQIMTIIYEFDKEFSVKTECVTIAVEKPKSDVQPQKCFYRPNKFNSSQGRVGFTFINFIKSSENNENREGKMSIDEELIQKIPELETAPVCKPNTDADHLTFEDALNDPKLMDSMKKFQEMYIQMKVTDISLQPAETLLEQVATKSDTTVNIKHYFDHETKRCVCKIILNGSVLIGKGSGYYNKKATEEAMLDFHRICMKGVNDSKLCCPPDTSSGNESDDIPEDAELFELPFLDDFYIRNNHTNGASNILLESFQYFKMSLNYQLIDNKVNLVINNTSILASMPLDGNLANTKTRLSKFVLKRLEASKWTLMRNALYINQFEDSIDKNGMYDKNLTDHTKIISTTNIGGQLMLKMGWTEESGLGKTGEGRKDPIINDNNGRRHGLGFNLGSSKDMKSFSNNVSQCLRNWIKEDEDDIIFDRNFDNKERAMIHKQCRSIGVTSKSFNNTNGERFLVVSKYRSPQELLKWVQSKGGETRLYKLLPPGFGKAQCE